MGREVCSTRTVLPFMGMVIVVLIQVSNMEVINAAMSQGMNKYVIIVYSDALSSLIFLLCSFIIHRSERPPLTFNILCRFFLLAVFGCSAQIFSFVGVEYSSPTLSTAMLNFIPAFTFVLAIIFRSSSILVQSIGAQLKENPIFALILRKFPAVLIIMLYLFFFNTFLSTAFALIVVTNPSAWKLRWDMGLVAILYSAVIGTGFRVSLCTWCLSKTGPHYVSMYKPLAVLFSIVMDIIFLGEALHLGSLIGAVIIVAGFYAVMWGKSKEEDPTEDCGVRSFKSSGEKVPLLQNRIEEKYCSSSI